jgi:CMP/dCMP kinase
MERKPGGLLGLLGQIMPRNITERYLNKVGPDFNMGQYVDFLKKIIISLADENDVVIVGRGAQFILPSAEHILKTLLIADLEDRIAFLVEHHDFSPSDADRFLRKEDRIRKSFLKLLDPRDPDAPECYDLVLNLSELSLEEAENVMVNKILELVDRTSQPIW